MLDAATSDRPVASLLARASERVVVHPADGKSQATFEYVTIDGQRYFLKRVSAATDWVMRCSSDEVNRPFQLWNSGFLNLVPSSIDHTVVAMELDGVGSHAELSMLMRDVGPYLVPEGSAVVPEVQHQGFINDLAELSVAFWGWRDTIGGLSTMAQRFRFFDPENIARELILADPPEPIVAAESGWRLLADRSPRLAELTAAVRAEPEMLTDPLMATPVTFLHGDWKMGNLGMHPDGRTILLDWTIPGSGPPCWDLCWYLGLNRERLPESKEATIARFRTALEVRGIEVGGWFDTQLDLCTIGIMATFAWQKAFDEDAEFGWWERRVMDAAARQHV